MLVDDHGKRSPVAIPVNRLLNFNELVERSKKYRIKALKTYLVDGAVQ